jgi:SAM-dependent methyltransferase
MSLSEWHSGYRAYRVESLKEVPFETNSDGFDFDTEIILQLHEAEMSIVEVPIPTFYGDEICYVSGLRYARDVVRDVLHYRLHKMGFGSGRMAFGDRNHESKVAPASSHVKLLQWVSDERLKRVLELGCADGRLGESLRISGHYVIGVDAVKVDGVVDRLDDFVVADLNAGVPSEVGKDFDVVLAADVFEHLAEPSLVMSQLGDLLGTRGVVLVSVPNIAHWYARLRVATGRFDYERRGIFDAGHLRFFTGRSFTRMANDAGMQVRRMSICGLPVGAAQRGGPTPKWISRLLTVIDRVGLAVAPSLFAYELLFELEPSREAPLAAA